MLVLWEERWAPDDTVTGAEGDNWFEGMRNGLSVVAVKRVPGSCGLWRAGLYGVAPHPELNGHDMLHPEKGRYATSDDARAAADDYLGWWLTVMDMTVMGD